MNEGIVNSHLQEADRHLPIAQEEMSRPAEDVVAQMVCDHSRQSILHFLTAFLQERGIDVPTKMRMRDQIARCIEEEQGFSKLKIAALIPSDTSNDFWMNEVSAEEHIELAEQVQVHLKERVTA